MRSLTRHGRWLSAPQCRGGCGRMMGFPSRGGTSLGLALTTQRPWRKSSTKPRLQDGMRSLTRHGRWLSAPHAAALATPPSPRRETKIMAPATEIAILKRVRYAIERSSRLCREEEHLNHRLLQPSGPKELAPKHFTRNTIGDFMTPPHSASPLAINFK